MPNDAKTKLARVTHRLQDQATTSDPAGLGTLNQPDSNEVSGSKTVANSPAAVQRQPLQAQQRDTTGTILPGEVEVDNGMENDGK